MRVLAGLATMALLAACSGNPQPGDSGYAYNVTGDYELTVLIEGMTYSGMAAMSTMKGGEVTGSMDFTSPEAISGALIGTVVGDSMQFSSAYERSGCVGVLTGQGTIAEGGASAAGSVAIDDDCAPGPMAGSFELVLQ